MWQLGWYPDAQQVYDPATDGVLNVNLKGVADYSEGQGDVLYIKVADGSGAYYIGFNRKTGFNAGTVEGGDKVLLVKKANGDTSYGPTTLITKLDAGMSKTFSVNGIFVTLTVNSISFPYADITLAPPPPCTDSVLELTLTTDNYPSETSWEMKNTCSDEIIGVSPSYSSTLTEYTHTFCVKDYHDFEFTINDQWGDGICKCNFWFIFLWISCMCRLHIMPFF